MKREYKMANTEKLGEFHKKSIALAASKLFLQKGIEKTKMDEIAREADYSKATLYVYFKGKEEIFYYIVLECMEKLHERVGKVILDHKNALLQFKAACQELADFAEQHPIYFEAMLDTIAVDEMSMKQTAILKEIYLTGEQLNEDIAIIMKNGIDQGVFKDNVASLQAGMVCWAAISGVIRMASKKQSYLQARIGMDKEAFIELGVKMMLGSVCKEGVDKDQT